MSYTFLLDAGAESLAESFSDIPPSVLSRLCPTADNDSCSDSETASCPGSQSGTTCEHSTGHRGVDESMSSAVDSHARTFPAPAKEPESPENEVVYGLSLHESLARYDRDSRSWKTAQCSLFGGLVEFSETWPRWGTMLDGVCWAHTTLVLPTSGNESGYLPTPTVQDAHGRDRHNQSDGSVILSLLGVVRMFPTPRSSDANGPGIHGSGGTDLRTHVQMFPTPTVQDSKNNGGPSQSERNTPPLNAVAGGKLNPDWVEWLMGWPIGWTDLQPLVMDRSPLARPLHGEYSFRDWLEVFSDKSL